MNENAKMDTESKYGQYFLQHGVKKDWSGEFVDFMGAEDFKSGFSALYLAVTEATTGAESKMHVHEFDEYLTFIGLHENGIYELGGEAWVCMGEEQEKHIIDKPTTIYIPKGLAHCPMGYTRVDKPILLIHLFETKNYKERKYFD